jgi:NADH-quinone oxidoreductase subunit I
MEDKKKNAYLKNIKDAFSTLKKGMGLTMDHARGQHRLSGGNNPVWSDDYLKPGNKHFTLKYPYEEFPIPDHGRYKLDNEIEDCIVCDKCAKVCPVDCIDIEPIRSPEVFGHTSDGTPKRIYAAKFDIDMAKCCFCGLCTTVCPTECLTMTPEYDFSAFDFAEHKVSYAEMTPLQILEAKQKWQEHERAKEAKKEGQTTSSDQNISTPKPGLPKAGGEKSVAKPAFRPKVKPSADPGVSRTEGQEEKPTSKTGFRPKIKPKPKTSEESHSEESSQAVKQASPEDSDAKPKFRPKIKPVIKASDTGSKEPLSQVGKQAPSEDSDAKPKFRPKIKPKIPPKNTENE